MFSLYITLFIAGALTILLPCILPLIPIVLGVSIAGRSKWRPLLVTLGMVISFVGFTFLLLLVLNQFVETADIMRIATYYALLLFGFGFLTRNRTVQLLGAVLGGFFFWDKGWIVMTIAQTLGAIAMEIGGKVAQKLQQVGTGVQAQARAELGEDSPLTAFILGLTMGLVWVPCAGPALGFAFTLVRDQPGLQAFLALSAYGLGSALPLMIIGYGSQAVVSSFRSVSRYSGHVKHVSGVILILTALAFQFHWFREIEIFLVTKTSFGNLGVEIEERLFGEDMDDMVQDTVAEPMVPTTPAEDVRTRSSPEPPRPSVNLPKLIRAPEFQGLGPWHSSEPFTLASLKGKVVLIDFWTYSCINCIRTLPYIQGYWEKYKDQPFVLLGVHTPEFVFEKSEKNVAEAIARHGLTYPVAQDNDYETWRAFANRYWPAKYLIDAEGVIRYTHFGEGAYAETDEAIAALLAEIGVTMEDGKAVEEEERAQRVHRTPETYLGTRSWPALQNGSANPTEAVVLYAAPSTVSLNKYALDGQWQLVDGEKQVLRSDEGEIRMRFLGGEINLVFGIEEGSAPAIVDVEVDGEHIKTLTVDFDDLYELFRGVYGEHEIVLRVTGAGLAAYAFTFGA